ncbi:HAD family phosphatase [Caproiciproducens galactitolivorans]|uniref:Phosphorylated carbohydrates phosphatase n=1 Tax=Caproiciproducens galactitolivorans TaxID=642589 RepID=A0A4Z0YAD6_9FIRM|nr:HAD family phosphatase [Caproiciproducens galactitolivorans]QEY33656.1 HAD family phosphatase [Caproiciproducens galactitolivorans]TGJ76221.1 phosphorylated carbohydrates phosphatase [Caproiciproducens galactitolivorans]
MIKAVIFDMDGTMFDTERVKMQAWAKAGQELHCADAHEIYGQIMGFTYEYVEKAFKDAYGKDFPYEDFIKLGTKYFKGYLAENGVPVKAGLYTLLDYLKANGYKIAVATSTQRKTTLHHLKSTNTLPYFDAIVCGDMLEKSKPDPDIYLKAAAALQVPPTECMAVEDSLNGITSAYRAGMKTVMVPDMVKPNSELNKMLYACVKTLDEIIAIL